MAAWATRLSPGEEHAGAARRAPVPAGTGSAASGWLTSSDSISHGRFAPGDLFDARYRIIGLLASPGERRVADSAVSMLVAGYPQEGQNRASSGIAA